eukprot:scaffold11924_cov118-Cylindrotheca_fusiformis.AAC.8
MTRSKGGFKRGFLLEKRIRKTGDNESFAIKPGFLLRMDHDHKSKKADTKPRVKNACSHANGVSQGFLTPGGKVTSRKSESNQYESRENQTRGIEKKRRKGVSTDLKAIEDNRLPTTDSFLFLEKNQSDEPVQRKGYKTPLISVMPEVAGESSSATNPLTSKADIALGQDIRNPPDPSSKKNTWANKKRETLFQEVPSILKDRGSSSQRPLDRRGGSAQAIQNKDLSLLKFQQYLEDIMWQNEHNMANTARFATTKWTSDQAALTWQRLLQASSPERHSTVVQFILFHHPCSVLPFLETHNQHHRLTALKVVRVVRVFLEEPYQDDSPVEGKVVVLNSMSSLWQQKRHTVLAQESWTVAVLVLCSIGNDFLSKSSSALFESLEIKKLLSIFEDLITTRLSWLQVKRPTNKRQIEMAILKDWSRVTQLCRENMNLSLWEQLCHNVGGVRQCFCNHQLSWTALKVPVQAFLDSTPEGIKDPYELNKRSLLRGTLASLRTRKFNAKDYQDMADLMMRVLATCKCSDSMDLALFFPSS